MPWRPHGPVPPLPDPVAVPTSWATSLPRTPWCRCVVVVGGGMTNHLLVGGEGAWVWAWVWAWLLGFLLWGENPHVGAGAIPFSHVLAIGSHSHLASPPHGAVPDPVEGHEHVSPRRAVSRSMVSHPPCTGWSHGCCCLCRRQGDIRQVCDVPACSVAVSVAVRVCGCACVCGCVWLCVAVCGCVWLCVAVSFLVCA